MKMTPRILMTLVSLGVACIATADEQPALAEQQEPGRWRISAGARLAPGVKTKAAISSRAVIDAAGRLRGANGSKNGGALPSGSSSSTERSSATSTDTSAENVPVTPTSRFEFDNGFIDMDDTTEPQNETWYWHFDSADAFDESTGGFTGRSSSTVTTRETSTSQGEGEEISVSSSRSSLSEQVSPDVTSSREADLWGGDIEIGYDFWRGERFSLGIGLGATLYRGDDAIRAAGRCYAASSSTARKTATGRFSTTTETAVETTETTTKTTTFTDANFAYSGALDDLMNDDRCSIGAGDRIGRNNPYGGGNPSLILSDGGVTKTTTVETRKDTTATTTRTFEATGSKSGRTSARRVIDVAAEGDVETQEIRLALQPAWMAADWLELRGTVGAVATRVRIDADATILVNGSRFTTVSGDDDDWVFAGLCGLDAVFSPLDWLSVFVGADLRLGGNTFDYEAGLVKGSVELARATCRAGVAVRF